MTRSDVDAVLQAYPRIYFACHTRHVHDAPSGLVLSRHQASILSHLDDVDPISLSDLAAHMGVTPSTMSLSIKRLERQGCVGRSPDPRDGRSVELRLTELGVRIRDSQSVLDPDRVRGVLDSMPESDRHAALRGLRILAEASGEWMRSRSAGRRAG